MGWSSTHCRPARRTWISSCVVLKGRNPLGENLCNVLVRWRAYKEMVDESMVIRDLQGEGSFDAFFVDRFAELSRLAFLLTGSSGAAEEIAQDACEQVFRRWDDVTHPRAYARVAVVNGARAWGRRRSRRAANAAEVELASAVDVDEIAVRAVLADLPQDEREVLVWRFYADLKVDDIAAELEMPAGTVKSHIHRGLARMHKELS